MPQYEVLKAEVEAYHSASIRERYGREGVCCVHRVAKAHVRRENGSVHQGSGMMN